MGDVRFLGSTYSACAPPKMFSVAYFPMSLYYFVIEKSKLVEKKKKRNEKQKVSGAFFYDKQ